MIKKITAKEVKDSREESTICVIIKTKKGNFITSAPSGKSTGKFEVKPYHISLEEDINYINNLDSDKINEIINSVIKSNSVIKRKSSVSSSINHSINHSTNTSNISNYLLINSKKLYVNFNSSFEILKNLELLVKNKIGGNSLFALEASLLKALAKEKNQELFEFLSNKNLSSKNLNKNIKNKKLNKIKKLKIRPIGNAIGGGLHSIGINSKNFNNKKPDFQEFLFIPKEKSIKENVKINEFAYNLTRKFLKSGKRNDEGAWETEKSNSRILEIMKKVQEIIKRKYKKQVDIGIDVAASSFYNIHNKGYFYKNPLINLNSEKQINYIFSLIRKYNLNYVEDALNEKDFLGFSKLLKLLRKNKDSKNCLIVGDDLTTTNPERAKKAIKNKSINAIIIKPNQIGSLIKVKEVIDIAKKARIKTIISHRSGETLDNTIADLAVAFNCDFIKTGIYGHTREAKLKRLVEIERKT